MCLAVREHAVRPLVPIGPAPPGGKYLLAGIRAGGNAARPSQACPVVIVRGLGMTPDTAYRCGDSAGYGRHDVATAPASRLTATAERCREHQRADYSAKAARCYHSRMLDQLDALTSRMQELVAHVRQLRDENHHLRTQLATSQTEVAALNERIVTATRRLDALIERLPADMPRNASDADAG